MLSEESFPVFIVDDDDSVRKALKRLLIANGYRVMTFASAEDFLLDGVLRKAGCMILDIQLPAMSGLDLHGRLASSEANYPVIFITAHDNPQWQEKARELGAVAYLRKPFDQQSLLDALHAARRRLEGGGNEKRLPGRLTMKSQGSKLCSRQQKTVSWAV